MKAAYGYILINQAQNHTTQIGVLAETETEARSKAVQLLGDSFSQGGVRDVGAELKLVSISDVELLKQRLEQSFKRDVPDWMKEENS